MSAKKSTYPLAALLVYPFSPTAPGERVPHWDQVRVRAVTVLKVNGPKALVRWREGSHVTTESVGVENLASTPERAAAMIQASFVALLSGPLLTTEAGTKESNATAIQSAAV